MSDVGDCEEGDMRAFFGEFGGSARVADENEEKEIATQVPVEIGEVSRKPKKKLD